MNKVFAHLSGNSKRQKMKRIANQLKQMSNGASTLTTAIETNKLTHISRQLYGLYSLAPFDALSFFFYSHSLSPASHHTYRFEQIA